MHINSTCISIERYQSMNGTANPPAKIPCQFQSAKQQDYMQEKINWKRCALGLGV